jgi:hypothetical protein
MSLPGPRQGNLDERRHEWATRIQQRILITGRVQRNHDSSPSAQQYLFLRKDEFDLDVQVLDLRSYLSEKPNLNVLFGGEPGQGKSELARHALLSLDRPKAILSFKPRDIHLRIGYRIVDMSRVVPNPFLDTEAFIAAFAVAFPVDVIGVVAGQVPALLYSLAKDCDGWTAFLDRLRKGIRHTGDKVRLAALQFIQEHVTQLAREAARDTESLLNSVVCGKESLVFDFSSLDESGKTFYSELLLRQLWSRLKTGDEKNQRVVIFVEEAHRLTQGTLQRYRSILYEIAPEIRELGALWLSSQNYSDIEDGIRNMLATQFLFKTTSKADLDALRTIDPMLAWTAASLGRHCFFDAKEVDHDQVELFRYNPYVAAFDGEKIGWNEGPGHPPIFVESGDETVDVRIATRIIREQLKDRILYPSEFAQTLTEKYGIDKNAAKLLVKDALWLLVEAGEVRRMEYERADSQTVVLHYSLPPEARGESILHQYLVRDLRAFLEGRGDIVSVSKIGENAHDLETKVGAYEVETGLKKMTIADLKARIAAARKPVTIVVFNSAIKERYARLASERVVVGTMRDLALSIRPSVGGR